METFKLYSMIYDSPKYGNNGLGDYLGEFKNIKQLREDAYVDDFIGVNVETNEVCLVLSREVCGYGGGIAYQVIPIPELRLCDESISISQLTSCQDCDNYNWDMPQCRECNATNNFKYFTRKHNDYD